MTGISRSLYNRLRNTLLECGPFFSEKELRATFVDARVSMWHDNLPHAEDPTDRVKKTIDFLHNKYNDAQENALVLFLYVLADQTDPGDACHRRLSELAGELARTTPAKPTSFRMLNPIARSIRYKLPNQKYLQFVNRHILLREGSMTLVDPFMIEVSLEEVESAYISRQDSEKAIGQPEHKIIIGPEGRGKTTLAKRQGRNFSGLLRRKILNLTLSLSQIDSLTSDQDLVSGTVDLLTPDILTHYIFNAYWEQILLNGQSRATFLPTLRRYKSWMLKLRWFYQNFTPIHHRISEEFELMAWLDSPISDPPLNPSRPTHVLQELVDFICKPGRDIESISGTLPWPCERIQLFIDGTEHLSGLGMSRLMQNVQQLASLPPQNLSIQLFTCSVWRNFVEEFNYLKQQPIPIYDLPPWSASELREMLMGRMAVFSNEFVTDKSWNWAERIPGENLRSESKSQFIDVVIRGALRSRNQEEEFDAPVHALRLTRGLLAACAGCWEEYKNQPLETADLEKIVDLYWGGQE